MNIDAAYALQKKIQAFIRDNHPALQEFELSGWFEDGLSDLDYLIRKEQAAEEYRNSPEAIAADRHDYNRDCRV